MADKSWMLNPKAIRHANECIHRIKELEGLRLKLSQPDFLPQLHHYVDKLNDRQLGDSYAQLLGMAGVGAVVRNLDAEPAQAVVAQAQAVGDEGTRVSDELVHVEGKSYPKYRNGREFKGLFHGVPRYR